MEIKEEKTLSENNTQKVISIIKGFLVELEGRMNKKIDDNVCEGAKEVYIGVEPPTDPDVVIWINPNEIIGSGISDEQIANAIEQLKETNPELFGGLSEEQVIDLIATEKLYVTPQMYGAKADGTTDDTVAVKEAMEKGLRVYFPNGTYLVSETLSLRDGQTLFGNGIRSTIKCSNGFTGNLIEMKNIENAEIKDLALNGGCSGYTEATKTFTKINGTASGIGLLNSSTTICKIINLDIRAFSKYGINIGGVSSVFADNVTIYCCGGYGLLNASHNSLFRNINIESCGIVDKQSACILNGTSNTFTNFKVCKNNCNGVSITNATKNCNYDTFYISENEGLALNIQNNGTTTTGVEDNKFSNIIMDSNINGIYMEKASNNVINGDVIDSSSSITTTKWLETKNCMGRNYIDVMSTVSSMTTDNKGIVLSNKIQNTVSNYLATLNGEDVGF